MPINQALINKYEPGKFNFSFDIDTYNFSEYDINPSLIYYNNTSNHNFKYGIGGAKNSNDAYEIKYHFEYEKNDPSEKSLFYGGQFYYQNENNIVEFNTGKYLNNTNDAYAELSISNAVFDAENFYIENNREVNLNLFFGKIFRINPGFLNFEFGPKLNLKNGETKYRLYIKYDQILEKNNPFAYLEYEYIFNDIDDPDYVFSTGFIQKNITFG